MKKYYVTTEGRPCLLEDNSGYLYKIVAFVGRDGGWYKNQVVGTHPKNSRYGIGGAKRKVKLKQIKTEQAAMIMFEIKAR